MDARLPKPWILLLSSCFGLLLAGVSGAQTGELLSPIDQELIRGSSERQRIAYAAETRGLLEDFLRDLLRIRQDAERQEDLGLLNLVIQKRSEIKGLLKVVEDASAALERAQARKDAGAAQGEFRRIVIARRQAERFFAEVEAALEVSEGDGYPGSSKLTWSYPGSRERYHDDSDLEAGTVRPPPASPF
jgi:hypothetical protein